MAIRVKSGPDGLFAECDTPAEAAELLRKGSLPTAEFQTHVTTKDSMSAAPDKRVLSLIQEVNHNALKFLRTVANHPEGIEGESLSKEMDIDASAFGGINAGISRLAKKWHLRFEDLVLSEVRFDRPKRYRWFRPMDLLIRNKQILEEDQ